MKKISLLLFSALIAFNCWAQTADDDEAIRQKITEATINVYNKHLEKDPSNYTVRFARAYQYYLNGNYDEALIDVNQALNLMPAKDDDRADALILRAKLYDRLGDYEKELNDLREASNLDAGSLPCINMLGELSYKLGDYEAAAQNFRSVLRMQPQNYEAMFNLAKVEAKRNNNERAINYANEAVNLYPAQSQVYVNRAEVLNMLGQSEDAAQDLIVALSVGNDHGEAVQALVDMTETHYDDVMKALQNSIDKAPRVSTFYYFREQIAMKYHHYGQALKSIRGILDNRLDNYYGLYYDAAECLFHLTQYDEAMHYIDQAIALEGGNIPEYYVLKSRIAQRRGRGNNYADASAILDKAAALDAVNPEVLLAQAQLLIAQRNDGEALKKVNMALASAPTSPEALLLRGWLNKNRLKNAAAAQADFEQVVKNGVDMQSLAGFALHELGHDQEARQWATQIIQDQPLPGGEAYILAAALLSDIGDNEQAIKYLEAGLANGYGSLFEVKVNEDPYVNLKPVRSHSWFPTMTTNYQQNFQER